MLLKRFLKERFDTGKKPTGEDFAALIDGLPRQKESFVTTKDQTVVQLNGRYTMNNNQIEVVVGGVRQYSPDNFTETSPTTITFNSPVAEGIDITVVYFE